MRGGQVLATGCWEGAKCFRDRLLGIGGLFVETDWRLLLVAIAYVWVVVGMWFTVSPWRARDLLEWATANDGRIKTMAIARVGLAALLLVLGLTVFRTSASP